MVSTQLMRTTDLSSSSWAAMKDQAAVLRQSGFLPKHITTDAQAIAIMVKGRELGLPPMYALSNISVISGKPVAGAEVLQALIYRDQGDNALIIVGTDDQGCTIEYRRRGWATPQQYSFTIEDAKKAGLMSNPTWQKYPAAMCRARCISAVARMAFADSIAGMYVPDELGATATVDRETGEIIYEAPAEEPAPVPAKRLPHPGMAVIPPRAAGKSEQEKKDEMIEKIINIESNIADLKEGYEPRHREALAIMTNEELKAYGTTRKALLQSAMNDAEAAEIAG